MSGFPAAPRRRRWTTIGLAALVLAGIPLHLYLKRAGDRGHFIEGMRAPIGWQAPTLAPDRVFDSASREWYTTVMVYVFVDPILAKSTRQGEALQAWHARYAGDRRLAIITVLAGDNAPEQSAYAQKYGLDPARTVTDRNGRVAEVFNITKMPTVFVVDPEGSFCYVRQDVVRAEKQSFHQVIRDHLPPESLWERHHRR